MIKLRKLTLDNINEIKILYKDTFMKEPWNDNWSDDNQLHLYITELIGNNNSLTFGLFDDIELIGISMGYVKHWYSSTEYNVEEFFIKPEKQNNGLGSDFLRRIESTMKEAGINAIFLQTDRNVFAYNFYRKNGFTELKNHVSLKKKI